MKNELNQEVSIFLNELRHPLLKEINYLRNVILDSKIELHENIKWNAPNYLFNNEDRITMRLQPPKQIQLIFHRGAKVKQQPKDRLINDGHGLLIWKANDRAIATFKSIEDISMNKNSIQSLVKEWVSAAE